MQQYRLSDPGARYALASAVACVRISAEKRREFLTPRDPYSERAPFASSTLTRLLTLLQMR